MPAIAPELRQDSVAAVGAGVVVAGVVVAGALMDAMAAVVVRTLPDAVALAYSAVHAVH